MSTYDFFYLIIRKNIENWKALNFPFTIKSLNFMRTV